MRLILMLSVVLFAQPPAASDWQSIREQAIGIITELAATRRAVLDPSSAPDAIRTLLESELNSVFQLGVESALKSGDENLRAAALTAGFARRGGFYVRAEHVVPQYLLVELFDAATGTLIYRGRGNRRHEGRVAGLTVSLPDLHTPYGSCPATLELGADGTLRGSLRCQGAREFPALVEIF